MKPIYSASWYLQEMIDLIGIRKVIICDSYSDLEEWYSKVSRVDPRVVLQDLIPGDDSCLYYACGYFDSEGKPEALFAGQKLRLTPIHFGSASFVKSIYDEALLDSAASLLSPLNYRGLFGVEFKKDPRDDIYKVIEVNVRWGLWDGMAARCGIDIAYLAYAREVGLDYDFEPRYREGVNWLSIRRDFDAFIDYRREGSLSTFAWIKSLVGETEHAVFAKDDIQPILSELRAIFSEKIGRRFRKSGRI
jgi:predicted ATP-grasp superfamily ATP-dependent carboligase